MGKITEYDARQIIDTMEWRLDVALDNGDAKSVDFYNTRIAELRAQADRLHNATPKDGLDWLASNGISFVTK